MTALLHMPDLERESAREPYRRRLRHLGRTYGTVLAVYGTLKLIGFLVFLHLLDSAGDFRRRAPRFGGGAHAWDVLATWDGWWYRQIAEHGYRPALVPIPGATGGLTLEGNSAAFFPLYPAAMRLASEVTGLGLYGAGMLVSVLASFAAALGIHRVTALLYGHRAGVVAAGLWAVWPGSGVEWAVYSDSLYVALAAWSCHAVIRRDWLTAGLLTFLAGLNRPTAVTLIAGLTVAALLAVRRERANRRDDDGPGAVRGGLVRPLAALAVAPLGLAGYLGWVGYRTGRPTGYFLLQSGAWQHEFDFGRYTWTVLTSVPVGHFDYPYAWPYADVIGVGVVLLALALIPALLQLRLPAVLVVHTVLTVLLILGSQQIFGNVSRYLLPAFPLFVPVALALSRLTRPGRLAVLALAATASGSYAGYALFELGVP